MDGQWGVGAPAASPLPGGGLRVEFPAQLDGVTQAHVTAEMTGDHVWTVTWEQAFPGAVLPQDFRAWIKEA